MLDRLALATRAHAAAEDRLSAAFMVLAAEEDDLDEDVTPEQLEAAAASLAGPFCGCWTCVIREVLDAAYPEVALMVALATCPN